MVIEEFSVTFLLEKKRERGKMKLEGETPLGKCANLLHHQPFVAVFVLHSRIDPIVAYRVIRAFAQLQTFAFETSL